MSNAYYNPTGTPGTASPGSSAPMRSEFSAIAAGFALLPSLAAGTGVVVNSAGTALTNTTGTLALAGNFATAGAFSTTLIAGASVNLTLPVVSGTLATLAGTESLSNKTLVGATLDSATIAGMNGTAASLNVGYAATAGTATSATTATTASSVAVGGVTGLGTGVATALANAAGGAGGFALFGSTATGNALFATTTGNVANDFVTLSNTTVGVQDSGLSLSTDGTFAANLDTLIPSQKAIKTYVAANAGSAAPSGAVLAFAGSSAPSGWLLCFGQLVSTTTYAALFAAIGTTFGSGSGTFGIPDLRGRSVFGVDNMGGTAANRLGSGNTGGITGSAVLGASGGQQSHTLLTAESPASLGGPFLTPTGPDSIAAGTDYTVYLGAGLGNAGGGGGAHNVLNPALVMNWIIKT